MSGVGSSPTPLKHLQGSPEAKSSPVLPVQPSISFVPTREFSYNSYIKTMEPALTRHLRFTFLLAALCETMKTCPRSRQRWRARTNRGAQLERGKHLRHAFMAELDPIVGHGSGDG